MIYNPLRKFRLRHGLGRSFFGPEFSGPKFFGTKMFFGSQTKIKNFQNDVDMSADPLEGLNFISSSETFNFDVRAHQGLNLDTECSFNEFMPQGVANETPFVPSANQNQESGQQPDVFDCNIKSEILRDDPCQPQTSQHQPIPGRSLEPEINQPKTGNTGSNIYQIPNDPKLTDNIVRTSGPSKSTMLQSQSIMVQGSQVQQNRPGPITGPKIVQGPIHIEPQPSEEEIKAKKEEMKAAKKGKKLKNHIT